ncbi:phosphate ABC transporter permease PstA [Lacrimispora indolis]|uniref:phosphate ABC transporter permease PstA n=1 Tax=Lacrimispora indolis TaxID=69825 RepID=UPI002E8DED99|nr:phosphate ABC transporter permease PstA [Lacrimispora indolis]
MLLPNTSHERGEVTMRINPKSSQKIAKFLIWTAALLVIAILFSIIIHILVKGIPMLSWQFLTDIPRDMGRSGGIASSIVGTLIVTAVAVIVATPFGIGTAIYLTEYTRESKVTRIIRFSAESLAGIPSIVYGLFGFIFFVIYLKMGWSILSGGLTMAIMILPTIIRTSEEAIRTVPQLYREVGFSLGLTKWQAITRTVLPSALPGIVNGVILSIGRCVAETAAVILTAGSALRMPASIFSPTRTMAVHFYILAREGISMDNAYGTAALLIILILLLNVGFNMLVNRFIAKGR